MPILVDTPSSAILATISLFEGIPRERLGTVIRCLGVTFVEYDEGEVLCTPESDDVHVNYLVSGSALAYRNSIDGTRSILGILGKGMMFSGEFYRRSPTSLGIVFLAEEHSLVMSMLLNESEPLHECCHKHVSRVRANLVSALMNANVMFLDHLQVLSCRTIREKVLAYFERISIAEHSKTFLLPYTQQEIADYLYVERSALARELSKMKSEGIIERKGNMYSLLQ